MMAARMVAVGGLRMGGRARSQTCGIGGPQVPAERRADGRLSTPQVLRQSALAARRRCWTAARNLLHRADLELRQVDCVVSDRTVGRSGGSAGRTFGVSRFGVDAPGDLHALADCCAQLLVGDLLELVIAPRLVVVVPEVPVVPEYRSTMPRRRTRSASPRPGCSPRAHPISPRRSARGRERPSHDRRSRSGTVCPSRACGRLREVSPAREPAGVCAAIAVPKHAAAALVRMSLFICILPFVS